MLESQPSGQPAAIVNHVKFLWPQRILATILATMFAIPTLVLLLAGLGMAADIIRGDFKMLKALPVVAVMAFNSGALSYFFFFDFCCCFCCKNKKKNSRKTPKERKKENKRELS